MRIGFSAALAISLIIGVSLGAVVRAAPAGNHEIKKETLDELLNKFGNKQFKNLRDFINSTKTQTFDNSHKINRYRLLGLYTRIKYQSELIRVLGDLVAIPTVKKEDQPQHENPAIHDFGKAIEKISKGFNLDYRNVDNRIFEVTLRGTGQEATDVIGVFTHDHTNRFSSCLIAPTTGRTTNMHNLFWF